MYLKELMVGKNVDIYIVREGYKYRVVSKVESVNENKVYVTLIASRSRVFRFLDSDQVDIVYGYNKKLFIWNNVNAGITELDGSQVHYFISERKGSIFNRRNAYRVDCDISVNLHYFKPNNELTDAKYELDNLMIFDDYLSSPLYDEVICKGLIRDLSETGVGIYANDELKKGDEITFVLLTKFGEVKCKAKVVRISKVYHAVYQYYYGCMLTRSNRELPKYIFELQRKLIHTTKVDRS